MHFSLSLVAFSALLPLLGVTAAPLTHEVRAPQDDYTSYRPVRCYLEYDGGVGGGDGGGGGGDGGVGGGDGGPRPERRELDARQCERMLKRSAKIEAGDTTYYWYGPDQPDPRPDPIEEKREANPEARPPPTDPPIYDSYGPFDPFPNPDKRDVTLPAKREATPPYRYLDYFKYGPDVDPEKREVITPPEGLFYHYDGPEPKPEKREVFTPPEGEYERYDGPDPDREKRQVTPQARRSAIAEPQLDGTGSTGPTIPVYEKYEPVHDERSVPDSRDVKL
ncbi:hypothetical protein V8E51_020010 [Hyaloscypha variabilis]